MGERLLPGGPRHPARFGGGVQIGPKPNRRAFRHICVTISCVTVRLILLLLLTGPAGAQTPIAEVICASRSELLLRLHGAEVAGMGLRDADAVVEVWTRPSGDWTLVQSYANGTACILAMGEAWEAPLPPPA